MMRPAAVPVGSALSYRAGRIVEPVDAQWDVSMWPKQLVRSLVDTH